MISKIQRIAGLVALCIALVVALPDVLRDGNLSSVTSNLKGNEWFVWSLLVAVALFLFSFVTRIAVGIAVAVAVFAVGIYVQKQVLGDYAPTSMTTRAVKTAADACLNDIEVKDVKPSSSGFTVNGQDLKTGQSIKYSVTRNPESGDWRATSPNRSPVTLNGCFS